MGKLIDFATGKEITKPIDKDEMLNSLLDGCVETAQHLVACVEEEIKMLSEEEAIAWLSGFNMREEQYGEARDMHVIVNLLHATFVRFLGLEHELQKDMDSLYIKLKTLEARKNLDKDNDTT
ncbi:MAG: hypothetical protein HKN86_04855 [Acidimicrobiia bacterium]|nr:hypothetical protein [Acidimicrobiia bacterium]